MPIIRIVIGMMGMDQHEVGAVTVSRMLMDAGMEVIYLGRFQSPQSMVNAAIEEGANLIGVSCHSWEYLDFVPEMLGVMMQKDIDIPVAVGGSVITAKDRERLLEMGVAAVFVAGAGQEQIVGEISALVAEAPDRAGSVE